MASPSLCHPIELTLRRRMVSSEARPREGGPPLDTPSASFGWQARLSAIPSSSPSGEGWCPPKRGRAKEDRLIDTPSASFGWQARLCAIPSSSPSGEGWCNPG
jgi:hypothetical protein